MIRAQAMLALGGVFWVGCSARQAIEKTEAPCQETVSPSSEPSKLSRKPAQREKKKDAGAPRFSEDDSDAARGAPPSPSDSMSTPSENEAEILPERFHSALQANLKALDDTLSPEALSCAGARPLRDAICAIEKELCKTVGNEKQESQCERARSLCAEAKRRIASRCQ